MWHVFFHISEIIYTNMFHVPFFMVGGWSKELIFLLLKKINVFCDEMWQKLNSVRKEMFYLTMHSTHFIYGYMASDIW